ADRMRNPCSTDSSFSCLSASGTFFQSPLTCRSRNSAGSCSAFSNALSAPGVVTTRSNGKRIIGSPLVDACVGESESMLPLLLSFIVEMNDNINAMRVIRLHVKWSVIQRLALHDHRHTHFRLIPIGYKRLNQLYNRHAHLLLVQVWWKSTVPEPTH